MLKEPITRLCKVREKYGYFHTWEHYSKPLPASPLIGGEPSGVYSEVFGIVEFSDGVKRVKATDICFCDTKPDHGDAYSHIENNKDDIEAAVNALNTFTHNWCMNCEETDIRDEPVFRCAKCPFLIGGDRCSIKVFVNENSSSTPDGFGAMSR